MSFQRVTAIAFLAIGVMTAACAKGGIAAEDQATAEAPFQVAELAESVDKRPGIAAPEETPTFGSAIYSPFARSTATDSHRGPTAGVPGDEEAPSLALTAAVSCLALGVLTFALGRLLAA